MPWPLSEARKDHLNTMIGIVGDLRFRKSECANAALSEIGVSRTIDRPSGSVPVRPITFNGKAMGRNEKIGKKWADPVFGFKSDPLDSQQLGNNAFDLGVCVSEVTDHGAEAVRVADLRLFADKRIPTLRTNQSGSFHSRFVEAFCRTILAPRFARVNHKASATMRTDLRVRSTLPKIAFVPSVCKRGVTGLGAKAGFRSESRKNGISFSTVLANLLDLTTFPTEGVFSNMITGPTGTRTILGFFNTAWVNLIYLATVFAGHINHGFHTMNYTTNLP